MGRLVFIDTEGDEEVLDVPDELWDPYLKDSVLNWVKFYLAGI